MQIIAECPILFSFTLCILTFADLDMSKNETEKSLLKKFETTKELKEVMVKKCNYSSFVGIDMSKNEKEKSILKQFRTTEELKNAMEKKCNLSGRYIKKCAIQVSKKSIILLIIAIFLLLR